MSTGTKITLQDAETAARRFHVLIAAACDRHQVAGSVRRMRPEVGDIEHVVISRTITATSAGEMFPREVAMVLDVLDQLVESGTIQKQIKSDDRARWGKRYRACLFEGVVHEVFIADTKNWGCQLAIRTGPAEYSQELVTRILVRGRLRQQGGYLCYASGKSFGDIYPCPDEQSFFAAAGLSSVPTPADRGQTT